MRRPRPPIAHRMALLLLRSDDLEAMLRIRLEEVKRRLRDTDSPVAEITAACGWANPDPPKRLFKKRFGCSMHDYRAQHHI